MDDLIRGLRNMIIKNLEFRLIKDYNELTGFIKARIIELLGSGYGAKPVEDDPSHIGFCQIGEIHGEHYPMGEKNYSAWVANSRVSHFLNEYGHVPLDIAMRLREDEVQYARERGTRIIRDVTVIFSPNIMYLVKGGGRAKPEEFKRFVDGARRDILQLLEGIAEAKDAFEFCHDIHDPNPDLSLRINDDIIKLLYMGGEASALRQRLAQQYKPEKPSGLQNIAA